MKIKYMSRELTDSELDDTIFKCENCGWWCETTEQNINNLGVSVCDDCIEDEDDDYDDE